MARASWHSWAGAFEFGGEVLTIKRLHLSSVRDSSGALVDLPGSDQLQINIVGDATYALADHLSLTLRAALPLLEREINVDGLSRSFTVVAGLAAEF